MTQKEFLAQIDQARIVNAIAGLTRTGQVVAVAAALRRGVDVFVHRMRKEGGNHHGE